MLTTLSLRLIEIDDFMASLWKVHLQVKKEGYAQVSMFSCHFVTA